MIGRLRGTIVGQAADTVVLDVSGTGYEVTVTPRALAELPGVGEEAVLHTHLHVREDNMGLFGFPSGTERDIFRLLLGASGVGPKVAMAICATLAPDDLRRAVMADDVSTLETVPGIGKRSAQKLILELRPRLELPEGDLPTEGSLSQVRQALEGLGYQQSEIRQTLKDLPKEGDVEDLLRSALKTLGGAR
ncbi:MAG: Holliday junction branch migration protein RuvA [Acidimicrobiia bacterium]|nr:Holliday junction branch migration protein RuvA [Acidimicrobiia bacterium]